MKTQSRSVESKCPLGGFYDAFTPLYTNALSSGIKVNLRAVSEDLVSHGVVKINGKNTVERVHNRLCVHVNYRANGAARTYAKEGIGSILLNSPEGEEIRKTSRELMVKALDKAGIKYTVPEEESSKMTKSIETAKSKPTKKDARPRPVPHPDLQQYCQFTAPYYKDFLAHGVPINLRVAVDFLLESGRIPSCNHLDPLVVHTMTVRYLSKINGPRKKYAKASSSAGSTRAKKYPEIEKRTIKMMEHVFGIVDRVNAGEKFSDVPPTVMVEATVAEKEPSEGTAFENKLDEIFSTANEIFRRAVVDKVSKLIRAEFKRRWSIEEKKYAEGLLKLKKDLTTYEELVKQLEEAHKKEATKLQEENADLQRKLETARDTIQNQSVELNKFQRKPQPDSFRGKVS